MLPAIINPLSVLISIAATLGVFVHDTQLCGVASVAVSDFGSAILASHDGGHINPIQHVHAESNPYSGILSLRPEQPSIQSRSNDEKRYIAQKRLMGGGLGDDYHWPLL
jgi:hypothetical protein